MGGIVVLNMGGIVDGVVASQQEVLDSIRRWPHACVRMGIRRKRPQSVVGPLQCFSK